MKGFLAFLASILAFFRPKPALTAPEPTEEPEKSPPPLFLSLGLLKQAAAGAISTRLLEARGAIFYYLRDDNRSIIGTVFLQALAGGTVGIGVSMLKPGERVDKEMGRRMAVKNFLGNETTGDGVVLSFEIPILTEIRRQAKKGSYGKAVAGPFPRFGARLRQLSERLETSDAFFGVPDEARPEFIRGLPNNKLLPYATKFVDGVMVCPPKCAIEDIRDELKAVERRENLKSLAKAGRLQYVWHHRDSNGRCIFTKHMTFDVAHPHPIVRVSRPHPLEPIVSGRLGAEAALKKDGVQMGISEIFDGTYPSWKVEDDVAELFSVLEEAREEDTEDALAQGLRGFAGPVGDDEAVAVEPVPAAKVMELKSQGIHFFHVHRRAPMGMHSMGQKILAGTIAAQVSSDIHGDPVVSCGMALVGEGENGSREMGRAVAYTRLKHAGSDHVCSLDEFILGLDAGTLPKVLALELRNRVPEFVGIPKASLQGFYHRARDFAAKQNFIASDS